MVLRCSLLGHDYGEADVEREREERGSEVIVTVTEYEECSRCGDKHLLSENTEVTSISSETVASDPPAPTAEHETAPEPANDEETDADAEFVDDDPDPAEEEPADAVELPTDENGDPITDDAEILEETIDPDAERGHGEWPDSEDVGPPVGADAEPTAWPDEDEDADADDREYEPAPDDGAEVLESGSETLFLDADGEVSDVGADRSAGTSEEGTHPAGTDSGTGIASAQSAPVPGESAPDDGVPTEFFCPQCSFLAAGDRGSLRPGDICPECRKGYLGERPRTAGR
ncbi:DUF7093 family protein [Natrononativus amylolyticus]|uniref:DUF7093 family protein n=1 Tax=Natrononativus amylolyticus TaxID=2963434 RepID=UPI0020CDD6E4|nr:hypothetical protein [Natrononativus amylolyticus]